MLKVENLCKKYPKFELNNISFELKEGKIVGFIGINGSGKTTTLKSMLNIVQRDSGEVKIDELTLSHDELEIKQNIGFMLGGVDYYPKNKIYKIAGIFRMMYKNWEENTYLSLLNKFGIDDRKKVSELSAGMKVKLGIIFALSHKAKILILDEPTSGLDPIARDELLDLFKELVKENNISLLFSTHITSDLDKCADEILFIRNGEIISNCTKNELIKSHYLIKGVFDDDLKSRVISYKGKDENEGLIKRINLKTTDKVKKIIPNLEDIMLYYNKEEK